MVVLTEIVHNNNRFRYTQGRGLRVVVLGNAAHEMVMRAGVEFKIPPGGCGSHADDIHWDLLFWFQSGTSEEFVGEFVLDISLDMAKNPRLSLWGKPHAALYEDNLDTSGPIPEWEKLWKHKEQFLAHDTFWPDQT